jgi:NAD/NADP transhydrogenase alpha subunit
VCVDLAAANGGNVAQTRPEEIVTTSNGVKIIGYTDLPSRLASTASNLVSVIIQRIEERSDRRQG